MSQRKVNNADKQRVLVIRVREWAAHLPISADANGYKSTNGEVVVDVRDNEKLEDLEMVNTNQKTFIAVPDPENPGREKNIQVSLVVFRATLTHFELRNKTAPKPIPASSKPKPGAKLQMPPGYGS